LESFSDDYQAIAGCAAISCLSGVEFERSTVEWPISQRLSDAQKSTAQYFAGIAHAFRYACKQPYQEYSGSFGHGYSWIGHLWMEANQVQGWLVKGTSRTPAQILTKSAWGSGMPAELRRLEALFRRAARAMPLLRQAATWCRSRNQLVGHGLKQDLPWHKVGILTRVEADWMSTQYPAAIEAYQSMLDSLRPENITLDVMKGLPRRNAEISAKLRNPSRMVEDTIRGRFTALSAGFTRRDAAREQKRPINDRIASARLETKLEVFHPLFLRARRFRVSEELVEAHLKGDAIARAELREQAREFCQAEPDPQLRELAHTWFSSALSGAE
jgi:hypothetical protein